MIDIARGARIVTFRLGRELFAADITSVERVLRYEAPRAIPNAPEWIEGVLQHEGRMLPVVDLRRRFGLTTAEGGPAPTRMLVLTAGGEWMAVVVDAVLDVRPLDPGEVAEPPRLFRGVAGEYLRGLLRRDGEVVVVLDVERLLSGDDHLALQQAAGER